MAAVVGSTKQTDLPGLEALALGQGGYFDRRDAHSYGITDSLLQYHTGTGRFERVLPGVYRLRVAPISPYDEYLLAWIWTNYRGAISHESALALYDLADILPTRVHVTVPRPFHRTSAPFQVHLAPLPEQEVQTYNGVRVTTPARAIIDAAATGTDPSQIHKVVREALDRGLVGPDTLRAATTRRTNQHRMDVRRLIEEARSDMTVRVKVSKKHQITVPSEVRKQLGIKSGDELLVELRGGYAVLLPEPRDYSERLRGLHRQVWAGIEPKEYVRQEREAWRT